MAKYRFTCEKCSNEKLVTASRPPFELLCDVCGNPMIQAMPRVSKTTVRETSDKRMNRKWLDDHKETMKARKERYFYEVEVPRLVASGVYSLETMLQNGWVYLDDSGKMHIHAKPPSQR